MFAQIVGKIRLRLAPAEPEWAQVAMYVSSRGLTTGPIPFGARSFQIDFDFLRHNLEIAVSDGQSRSIPLQRRSVARFYREVMEALRAVKIDVRIWPEPVEVTNPIRFDDDTEHDSYDPEYVNRFMRILVQVDAALKRHRAPFRHRHTLVNSSSVPLIWRTRGFPDGRQLRHTMTSSRGMLWTRKKYASAFGPETIACPSPLSGVMRTRSPQNLKICTSGRRPRTGVKKWASTCSAMKTYEPLMRQKKP